MFYYYYHISNEFKTISSQYIILCVVFYGPLSFVFLLLTIVSSVVRFTASDYIFGIFQLDQDKN